MLNDFDEDEKNEIIENEGEEELQKQLMFESKWRVPFELFANVYGKTIDQVYEENKAFKDFSYDKK